jgi:hypothetical protein
MVGWAIPRPRASLPLLELGPSLTAPAVNDLFFVSVLLLRFAAKEGARMIRIQMPAPPRNHGPPWMGNLILRVSS